MQATVLVGFCRKIGVEAADFKESRTECNLVRDMQAGMLKVLTEQDIAELVRTFGEACSLRIGIQDGPASLDIQRGALATDLTKAVQRIAQCDDTLELRLELSIDKTAILRQVGLADIPCYPSLYIFKDNLDRVLELTLPWLDENLFESSSQPTVIVVADAELYYSGLFLTIIGLKAVEQFKATIKPVHPDLKARVDQYHETARESLNWARYELKRLTPLHLLCQRTTEPDNKLDSLLAEHLLHLCILYTANRSTFDGLKFDATYAGSEQTGRVVPDFWGNHTQR